MDKQGYQCLACGRPADDCACDDDDEWSEDEDCDYCGFARCRCNDEPWGGAHIDGTYVYPTRDFLAEWVRDMRGAGNLNAIARHDNPHGVGLGGYPWQKRANRRKQVQARRRMGLRDDWSPF